MRHYCCIPGCDNPGRHAFTLRIRRPDATSIAAPNTRAWLCDDHAVQGLEIDIRLKPTTTGRIETYTWGEVAGVEGHPEKSLTNIAGKADSSKGAGHNGSGNTRGLSRPRGRRDID